MQPSQVRSLTRYPHDVHVFPPIWKLMEEQVKSVLKILLAQKRVMKLDCDSNDEELLAVPR